MRVGFLLLALALCLPLQGRSAIPEDPAITTVKIFQDALLANMRHDPSKLREAIRTQFHVSVMSAFIAGPTWSTASELEKALVGTALSGYLAARFAHEFDSYEGERFRIDPQVQARGVDKMIRTQVVPLNGEPIHLDYRLRAYDGQWRIIDVYYDGISQLATQRADVATLSPQAAALAKHFDEAASALK
jgi:phospholipid transport system substrate-binding protein